MFPFSMLLKMNLKYKLIIAFVVAIVPMMILVSYVSYTYLKQSILQTSEAELKNRADAVKKMVTTAASVSIRSYLRAIAEKNLEVIEKRYRDYRSGRIDLDEMVAQARTLFENQTIGNKGYIYCLDSTGEAVFHPAEGVQGRNFSRFPFIRKQLRKKIGYLEYDWENPEDERPRPKALYMVYFKPLDWIISVSAYRQEFKSLINLSDLDDLISTMRFGESGYAFLTDANGNLLIHPQKSQIGNFGELFDVADDVFQDPRKDKQGKLRYSYVDPRSYSNQTHIAYFDYIDAFGWYVGTSCAEDEIFQPLKTVRFLIVFMALLMLSMAIAVATWFSSYVNTHIQRLIDAFAQGANGAFGIRLDTAPKDEFGRLSRYFNAFMERLESYQRTLLEEIEKRRETQNTLYESEQRLKTLVKNAPMLLWAIDRQGILTFYEGDLPVRFDDCDCAVTGRPLTQVWQKWGQMPAHIDRALAGQSGAVLINEPDYAIEIHYNPLFDSLKEIYGAVGVALDVSSRWRAERKLTETEQERQKLVMAVEQAAEIIFITDISGKIEYVNPAFENSSGYTRSEAIGKNPNLLKSGRHDEAFYSDLWQTISAGGVWSGRIVNRKKDGTLFYEDATISPIRNEDGDIVNYVASKRDVSQEVILEDQLQHSQRMKAIGTLAGGIAHDFNNILSGMMGYTEMCLYDTSEESPLYSRLEKILQAGLRAKDLIRHIQTFSRQTIAEPIPMLPGPVVAEAVKLIEASFSSISFESRIEKVGAIKAVPTQIHQIVMNLCTNACHAMQTSGGRLTVTLSKEVVDGTSAEGLLDISPGEFAKLTVTDTGHGIPKTIEDKIFDPYFTTKKEGEGTGLGLSVVHGIVKNMGGAVKVYSEPGAGTTFTIFLPLIMSSKTEASPIESDMPKGNREAVLLVDDEAYVLETTQALLESLNYEVTTRNSTLDALKLFQIHPDRFDLVITDYSLPNMNGLQFAAEMKQVKPGMPVIISTGFSYDEHLEQAEMNGVATLINKPIIRSDLAKKIAAVLVAST